MNSHYSRIQMEQWWYLSQLIALRMFSTAKSSHVTLRCFGRVVVIDLEIVYNLCECALSLFHFYISHVANRRSHWKNISVFDIWTLFCFDFLSISLIWIEGHEHGSQWH
jgi:hypothetical protein